MNELKFCNHCPNRASCFYFKMNSFCKKDLLLTEQIYGFDKTQQKLLFKLMDIQNIDDNPNCKYSKMIRKEIKEIAEYFDELKEEELDEDARF